QPLPNGNRVSALMPSPYTGRVSINYPLTSIHVLRAIPTHLHQPPNGPARAHQSSSVHQLAAEGYSCLPRSAQPPLTDDCEPVRTRPRCTAKLLWPPHADKRQHRLWFPRTIPQRPALDACCRETGRQIFPARTLQVWRQDTDPRLPVEITLRLGLQTCAR